MGTKFKNTRKIFRMLSEAFACISAGLVILLSCVILFGYGVSSWNGEVNIFSESEQANELWLGIILMFVVLILTVVCSIVMTGDRDENGQIKINWFDRIFTEFQIAAAGLISIGFVGSYTIFTDLIARSSLFQELMQDNRWNQYYFYTSINLRPYWVEAVIACVLTLFVLWFDMMIFLSIVKKIKDKSFCKRTLIGWIVINIREAIQNNDNILGKVLIVLILGVIASTIWIGTVAVIILILILVPKLMKKYKNVKEGIDKLKQGDFDYKIPIKNQENTEMDKLAKSINEISDATKIIVDNELKNQRMKTDLISNVSHDLKTPLTSMISYVDLIKKEGLSGPNSEGYLDIVEKKTKRLQKLTEDLFEAAKASSGAMNVNIERIDIESIFNQAFGELEEKLKESKLDLIVNNTSDNKYVMADGQLLWRVIENLLVNTCKYALEGSRVYVDIYSRDEVIVLEMKNVSREPLNISTEELMERFKRGDESRNTEGSGLGLAIAKDLTSLMKGKFNLHIDGDLFKAIVELPTN